MTSRKGDNSKDAGAGGIAADQCDAMALARERLAAEKVQHEREATQQEQKLGIEEKRLALEKEQVALNSAAMQAFSQVLVALAGNAKSS